ncbi:uncharacterized protein LOC110984981 [Acanthaster planci]|uniref:Uncharacterized protein LOC110984981 n=1 Tax=Acanthaster planci TaxID=133434 RepID=A0A8B7ZDR6_ACAPL|nr:uncharacterized protein LOC110984981 [Acanthaster planci]
MAQPASFGFTREKLAELLSCPVCFEKFDDGKRVAKFLPCLHGFCVDCLGRFVQGAPTFKCPLCRRDTPVPDGGVQSLPDHFIVTKLKELDEVLNVDANRPHHVFRCQWCKNESTAVGFCPDGNCLAFLCASCREHHDRLKLYDGHVLYSMERLQEQPDILLSRHKLQCEQHKHALSVFCDREGCQRAMCLVCVTTAHQGHRVIDLDQKSSEVKEELQSLAQAAGSKKATAEKISGSISTEIHQTSVRFDEVMSRVSTVFEGLQHLLQTRQEEVISDLRKLCTDKTNQLKLQIDRAESMVSQFDSACQFAKTACEIGNAVDLLKTRGQIITRLHELIALDIDKSLPFQQADEVFLSFTTNHDCVLSEIERLIPDLGQFSTSPDSAKLTPELRVEFPGGLGPSMRVGAVQKIHIFEDTVSSLPVETLSERLFAYIRSPDGGTTECNVGKLCGDFYEFEFQPQTAGKHELSISISGLQITGSPFKINVVDAPSGASGNPFPSTTDDTQVMVSDVTWTDAFVRCEHAVIFKLRSPQNFPLQLRQISVQCTMPDLTGEGQTGKRPSAVMVTTKPKDALPSILPVPTTTEAQISETADKGAFRVAYTPLVAGKLVMKILVDSKPIVMSPILINVSPLHPNSTEVVPSCPRRRCHEFAATVDVPYTVIVWTRDYLGRRLKVGGYKITAEVRASCSSEADPPCNIRDNSDGSYSITFTPRTPKPHNVSINICGFPIKSGNPVVVPVQDGLTLQEPPGGYKSPSSLAADKDRQIVYVADGKNGCIHQLPIPDGCCMSGKLPIKVSLRRTLQIAVSTSGKLVLLVPNSSCVIICNRKGEEWHRWTCSEKNSEPTSITALDKDCVVIGDTKLQALFVYGVMGESLVTIKLPDGSLGVGIQNVCSDGNHNILVATHSKPYRILRYTTTGSLVSEIDSPAGTTQLAVAAMPEGVLVVSALGLVLVLELTPDREGAVVVRKFLTDYIYTGLAHAGKGCFVALDPGERHVAKYKHISPTAIANRQENGRNVVE